MPRKLHIPQKAPPPIAATRQDNAWHIGLVPSSGSYEPQADAEGRLACPHGPHVGRLSHQVNPLCEAASPRIIPGIIHLSAKNAWESKRTPRM
jgi:hypothetical protein